MYTEVNVPALLIIAAFLLFIAGWAGYRAGWAMRTEQYKIDVINANVFGTLKMFDAELDHDASKCVTCIRFTEAMRATDNQEVVVWEDGMLPPYQD